MRKLLKKSEEIPNIPRISENSSERITDEISIGILVDISGNTFESIPWEISEEMPRKFLKES